MSQNTSQRHFLSLHENGKYLNCLVGARGFEPRTSCAQGKRATRLRHAPTGMDDHRETRILDGDLAQPVELYSAKLRWSSPDESRKANCSRGGILSRGRGAPLLTQKGRQSQRDFTVTRRPLPSGYGRVWQL
jgi:hypothetical protein